MSITTPQTEHSYRRWLWALIAFQLVWWTVIPCLSHTSPPLDANEMHAWSLAPQWGYYKHPPLPVFWVWLSTALFGKTLFALFLPSSVAIALTYAAIWPVARALLPARQAVIALVLQSTVLFYHLWSTDFNHNVVQIPMWAWTLTAFYFAAAHPTTRGRLDWWLLFGAMLGLNALAKYTAALIVPIAIIILLWMPATRVSWGKLLRNTLAAFVMFAIVFGPHVVWLFGHDFGPLQYATGRMEELGETASWSERFVSYLGMLVLAHVVPLGVGVWLWVRGNRGADNARSLSGVEGKTRSKSSAFSADRLDEISQSTLPFDSAQGAVSAIELRAFWLLGFGPVGLTILIGLCGVSLAPMWSSAMLPWVGLAVMVLVQQYAPAKAQLLWSKRALAAWLILQTLLGTAYVVKGSGAWFHYSQRSARGAYPGPQLTAQLEAAWAKQFPGQKLWYVAGPTWEAGVVSFFAKPTTPQVLLEGNPANAPWIDLNHLQDCGGIFITPDAATNARFPRLQAQAPMTVAPIAQNFPTLHVAWSILPPLFPLRCRAKLGLD